MRALPVALALLVATACGDDALGTSEGDTASASASDSTSDTDEEGTSGDASAGSSTTGAIDPGPPPARGVMVPTWYADQGVAVPVGVDNAEVSPEGRNAHLIANRTTLLRGFVDVLDEGSWTPRELQARMTLHLADGSTQEANKTLMVAGDSVEQDMDTTFNFALPPEFVQPALRFEVELLETSLEMAQAPAPDPPPVFPSEGAALVGVEDSYMLLKVGLVPIKHELEGKTCGDAPELSESVVERLRDELLVQNPVERVEIEVLSEFVFTESMASFNPLLSALSQLRVERGAPPEQYYYGLTIPCDGGADGIAGQAIGVPQAPTKSNAFQRVAMGRFSASINSTAGTFVHEIGHTQGRFHVACSGTEGGPDLSYPYEAGAIGVYGFNILDWSLHTPTNKDYMTYCGTTWVSDWGWEQVYPVIQTLSSWDFEDRREPEGTLLIGALYPDGAEDWWTAPGSLAGEVTDARHALELETTAGARHRLPVLRAPRPDGATFNFAAELPVPLDAVRQLERVSEGARRAPVPLAAIRRLAEPR